MFTSLLVNLDGSAGAEVALAQAIMIGRRFRARIVLAHILLPPGRTGEMALGAPWMEWTPASTPHTRGEIEAAAREMIEDAAGAIRRAGLEAESVIRQGSTAEVLCDLAEGVGVVVVGRLGWRGALAENDPLGPDTRELIRHSPRPVLVTASRPTPMDRVMVAYAGGPISEGALAYAARFASISGSHLDVLHVNDDPGKGRQALAEAAGALSLSPLDYDLHLASGNLDTAVAHAVERLQVNALFAGAHREGRDWLVPPHTEAILRATDIPVVVHMQPTVTGARTPASHRRRSS